MYLVRKKYKIEYAHQLKSAFSKACSDTIHGHSGIIEVFITSDSLDENKMVIDFGQINSIIKDYIMDVYDHALFIPKSFNYKYIASLKKYNKKLVITDVNPTAEFFCFCLYNIIEKLLRPFFHKMNKERDTKIRLEKIRFHETDSGYAEYSPLIDSR